jgi:drug/metabolite transporter (DMT)-like permease
MNTQILGIALIILGVIAFAYQGITYTTQEKVLDVGPLKATVEKEKTIPLPPIVGAIALAGGIVLLAMGKKS